MDGYLPGVRTLFIYSNFPGSRSLVQRARFYCFWRRRSAIPGLATIAAHLWENTVARQIVFLNACNTKIGRVADAIFYKVIPFLSGCCRNCRCGMWSPSNILTGFAARSSAVNICMDRFERTSADNTFQYFQI